MSTADCLARPRERLAAAAFAHTAAYDAAVAGWFAEQASDAGLPGFVGLALEKVGDLRYGENPHQRGALYRESPDAAHGRRAARAALASSRARTCRSTTGSMRRRRYSLVAALAARAPA